MKCITIMFSITISSMIFLNTGCSNERVINQPEESVINQPEESIKSCAKIIKDIPTYKVATKTSYAPFVSQDENGAIAGLDIDLIRAIGDIQGFQVEFYAMPWNEVYDSLQKGQYDIAISGIHIEDDKYATFGISEPYLYDYLQIVSLEEKAITSEVQLVNKKIGAQTGTSLVESAEIVKGVEVLSKPTIFNLFQDMVQGKTDAFLASKSVSLYIAKDFPETKLNFSDYGTDAAKIGFFVNKEKVELLEQINKGLIDIKKSGRYDEINRKWFEDSADELMVK